MKRAGALAIRFLLALAVLAISALAYAQSFDIKLGQWQFTMSGWTGSSGDLSKVPPAMRAQIEAKLKQPTTYKSCLTAKDLKDVNLGKPEEDDDECKVTSKKMTATTADIVMTCSGDQPRTQTVHYDALSRESMRGTIKMATKTGPAEMTLTGKWIGAVCTEDN